MIQVMRILANLSLGEPLLNMTSPGTPGVRHFLVGTAPTTRGSYLTAAEVGGGSRICPTAALGAKPT